MAYYPYASYISIHKKAAKVNISRCSQGKIVTFTAKGFILLLVLCKITIYRTFLVFYFSRSIIYAFLFKRDGELPQEMEMEVIFLLGLDLGLMRFMS